MYSSSAQGKNNMATIKTQPTYNDRQGEDIGEVRYRSSLILLHLSRPNLTRHFVNFLEPFGLVDLTFVVAVLPIGI